MINKLKFPAVLSLIFLLNSLSLSACSRVGQELEEIAHEEIAHNGSKIEHTLEEGVQKTKVHPEEQQIFGASYNKTFKKNAELYAEDDINNTIRQYGKLPIGYVREAKQRVAERLIEDAQQMHVVVDNAKIFAIANLAIDMKMQSLPVQPPNVNNCSTTNQADCRQRTT